jgi:hypothetical protein
MSNYTYSTVCWIVPHPMKEPARQKAGAPGNPRTFNTCAMLPANPSAINTCTSVSFQTTYNPYGCRTCKPRFPFLPPLQHMQKKALRSARRQFVECGGLPPRFRATLQRLARGLAGTGYLGKAGASSRTPRPECGPPRNTFRGAKSALQPFAPLGVKRRPLQERRWAP